VLAAEVERLLREDGHEVRRFATVREVRGALAQRDAAATPALVCLDLLLPDGDGRALCGPLKERLGVPLLVLSALNEAEDRVAGLELGADDYLGKPFDPRELRARVRALLRRFADEPAWCHGPWRVEPRARRVAKDGRELALTAREFDLFWLLCRHPRRVWTREELAGQLWGECNPPDSRAVDMLVHRLRQKVEDDLSAPRWIETVRQVGYRWRP
jgi:DNA-binding response OmpR family regulator